MREPVDHIRPPTPPLNSTPNVATAAHSPAAAATAATTAASTNHAATDNHSLAAPRVISASPAALSPSPLSCDDEDIGAHHFRHADLLLCKYDMQLYIDVAVVRPTKASALSNRLTLTQSLHSTQAVATHKTSKYAAICKVNQYKFTPFVMETYGGIGREADRLLKLLAPHSPDRSIDEFLADAHTRLAVCLQQSNANLALIGQQRMHLKRRPVQPVGWQCRRVGRCTFPEDSSQLEERLSPQLTAAGEASRRAHNSEQRVQFVYTHVPIIITEPIIISDSDSESEHSVSESHIDLTDSQHSADVDVPVDMHSDAMVDAFLSVTPVPSSPFVPFTQDFKSTDASLSLPSSPHAHAHTACIAEPSLAPHCSSPVSLSPLSPLLQVDSQPFARPFTQSSLQLLDGVNER